MQRYDLQSIIYGIKEHSNIIPTNVVEVGSRDGNDAYVLAKNFGLSDENCYVFEPNPEAAENILKTYPRMHLYNNAVSDVSGQTLDFYVERENVGASSLLKRNIPNEHDVVKVETITMADWIEAEQISTIDVCKIDVEGMTLPVLESFGKYIYRLQSIQLEMEHGKEIWHNQTLYPEIAKWLENKGFVQIMFTLLRGIQSDSFWLRRERMLV
jgi:FkbM family methyltransferase